MWFTDAGNNSIGRITTSGVVTEFHHASIDPAGIAAGPDGALWFVNPGQACCHSIGRITTTGAFTLYSDPSLGPTGGHGQITTGPDGALWYTTNSAPLIGRITTGGAITHYSDNATYGIAAGPDGNVWATESNTTPGITMITTAKSVTVTPSQGPLGTAVTARGAGFSSGETVNVTYTTGETSPKTVALCSVTAAGDGTFSCSGSIPADSTAGSDGAHAIQAKGQTSHIKARNLFLLSA
jgi:virginiamycin B lyase